MTTNLDFSVTIFSTSNI